MIYAVGNAPTALLRLCELKERFRPEFIVRMPVDFVNVVQAKELLIASGMSCIVTQAERAAAVCNHMLDAEAEA